MKLDAVYNFFIKQGILADFRPRSLINKKLSEKRTQFKKLSKEEKEFFDQECLKNPYADTRILFGDRVSSIKRVLVGIDIGVGEILLADRLSQKGKKIDLVLSHHPEGIALAGLDHVMDLQIDLLEAKGIDFEIAKGFMTKRMNQIARKLHSANHMQVVDAARLLNIPLMCCHTPADNFVASYLQEIVDRKKPKTLRDLILLLLKEPEYQQAAQNLAGPKIFVGKETSLTGRVMVDMTGGAEGSKDIFPRISQAGINTLLAMHVSEEHFNRLESEYLNVVVAGHIASDNLGLNLILDELEKLDKFEWIECSGFHRIRR